MLLRTFITAALLIVTTASAQNLPAPASAPATRPAKSQAQLEQELSDLLTGATLEGSFTSTGAGPVRQPATRLSSDKYTLGTVRKLAGNLWLISARIQYGGRDVTVPITLPIEWAGDTPVICVNELTIPGMGTFSARVMFFDGHYSGYWKHGDRGGNMFGVIRRAPPATAATTQPATRPAP